MSSHAPHKLTSFLQVCDITGYIRNEEGSALQVLHSESSAWDAQNRETSRLSLRGRLWLRPEPLPRASNLHATSGFRSQELCLSTRCASCRWVALQSRCARHTPGKHRGT